MGEEPPADPQHNSKADQQRQKVLAVTLGRKEGMYVRVCVRYEAPAYCSNLADQLAWLFKSNFRSRVAYMRRQRKAGLARGVSSV